MEQIPKLVVRKPSTVFPKSVTIICNDFTNDERTINSQEDMNNLLEEVKLYNLEHKENQKRIISN